MQSSSNYKDPLPEESLVLAVAMLGLVVCVAPYLSITVMCLGGR